MSVIMIPTDTISNDKSKEDKSAIDKITEADYTKQVDDAIECCTKLANRLSDLFDSGTEEPTGDSVETLRVKMLAKYYGIDDEVIMPEYLSDNGFKYV